MKWSSEVKNSRIISLKRVDVVEQQPLAAPHLNRARVFPMHMQNFKGSLENIFQSRLTFGFVY